MPMPMLKPKLNAGGSARRLESGVMHESGWFEWLEKDEHRRHRVRVEKRGKERAGAW